MQQSGYQNKQIQYILVQNSVCYEIKILIDQSDIFFITSTHDLSQIYIGNLLQVQPKDITSFVNSKAQKIKKDSQNQFIRLCYQYQPQIQLKRIELDMQQYKKILVNKDQLLKVMEQMEIKSIQISKIDIEFNYIQAKKKKIQQDIENFQKLIGIQQSKYESKYELQNHKIFDRELIHYEVQLAMANLELTRIDIIIKEYMQESDSIQFDEIIQEFIQLRLDLEKEELRIQMYLEIKQELLIQLGQIAQSDEDLNSARKQLLFIQQKIDESNQNCLFIENDILCKGEFLEIATLKKLLKQKDQMIKNLMGKNNILGNEIEQKQVLIQTEKNETIKIIEEYSKKEQTFINKIDILEHSIKKQNQDTNEYYEWKNRFGNIENFINQLRQNLSEEIDMLRQDNSKATDKYKSLFQKMLEQQNKISETNHKLDLDAQYLSEKDEYIDGYRAEIIKQRLEIEELIKEKHKLNTEIFIQKVQEIQDLKVKLQSECDTNNNLRKEKEQLKGLISTLRERVDQLFEQYSKSSKENDKYQNIILLKDQQIASWKNLVTQKCKELEIQINKYEIENKDLKYENENLNNENKKLQQQLQQIQNKYDKINSQLEGKDKQLDKDDFEQQIKHQNIQIQEKNQELQQKNEMISLLNQQSSILNQKFLEINERVSFYMIKINDQEVQFKAQQNLMIKKDEKFEKIEQQLKSLENEFEQEKNKLQNIQQKLKEQNQKNKNHQEEIQKAKQEKQDQADLNKKELDQQTVDNNNLKIKLQNFTQSHNQLEKDIKENTESIKKKDDAIYKFQARIDDLLNQLKDQQKLNEKINKDLSNKQEEIISISKERSIQIQNLYQMEQKFMEINKQKVELCQQVESFQQQILQCQFYKILQSAEIERLTMLNQNLMQQIASNLSHYKNRYISLLEQLEAEKGKRLLISIEFERIQREPTKQEKHQDQQKTNIQQKKEHIVENVNILKQEIHFNEQISSHASTNFAQQI